MTDLGLATMAPTLRGFARAHPGLPGHAPPPSLGMGGVRPAGYAWLDARLAGSAAPCRPAGPASPHPQSLAQQHPPGHGASSQQDPALPGPFFMNPEPKVTPEHLKRTAYLYVRQSTLRRVLEHGESAHRQYALRQRAVALGWGEDQIIVVDGDTAHSAASAAGACRPTNGECSLKTPTRLTLPGSSTSKTCNGSAAMPRPMEPTAGKVPPEKVARCSKDWSCAAVAGGA